MDMKGKRVLVAKPRPDSHRLAELLRERGARVTELPAPEVEYLPFALPRQNANLLLPNAEAVTALFLQLEREETDVRALAGCALVCETGDAERALRARGLRPDGVKAGECVQLCCEGEAGLPVWRRIMPEAMAQAKADYVAFTTLSSVEAFEHLAVNWDLSKLTAVCIGDQTAAAAQSLGMKVIRAKEKTIESMVDAM